MSQWTQGTTLMMNRRLCNLILIEAVILNNLYDRKINAAVQYRSKDCRKRTIIQYDLEKGVLSKLMQIPICCKGWREVNDTTCKKEQASRGYPFQDTKIAKTFLKSKRTKRSWLDSTLYEECKDGSCSYEEAEEHNLNRREICEFFKTLKCSKQNCQIGYYCDTLIDNGCGELSQYVITCKACESSTYGVGCQEKCSCQANATCNRINGDCVCNSGLRGQNCSEACKDFTFGEDCKQQCTCVRNNTRSCDPVSGICYCKPGWTDTDCTSNCDAGYYGNSCNNRCNCQIKDGYWKKECNKIDGTCYCEDGYTGVNCIERCEDGFFGSGCNKNCSCQHANSCNPVNGICNCTTPGWKGKYCEQPCESGTYGVGCQENCTCPANSTCNRINGDCVCNSGLRGHNCSEALDITTQQIFEDQEPQGSTSQQDKTNIIIAAVTLGTLIVSIIIIITVVYKRKNGQQTMPSENVYAELNKMSQPLSQEYMYEDLRSRNSLEDPKSLNQHQ